MNPQARKSSSCSARSDRTRSSDPFLTSSQFNSLAFLLRAVLLLGSGLALSPIQRAPKASPLPPLPLSCRTCGACCRTPR